MRLGIMAIAGVLFLLLMSAARPAAAQQSNLYCLTGTSSTGAPLWQPASSANPCPATMSGGAGSNAAASTTGSAVPASAGYTGFSSGGNLVGVSSGAPLPVTAATLPLPAGAATSANQEVTAAGVTATSAQGVQGVTGGVALPIIGPVTLPTSPTLAAGSGVVPTQGGAVISATNGSYTNILQGNAVISTGNPLPTSGPATLSDGSDATQGAKADAVCGTAAGTCSVTALLKFLNTAASGAIPAGTNTIGAVSQANGDPCASLSHVFTPISISSAANTKIVSGTSAKKTYICHLFLFSAAADNVGIVEGSGTNCGTSALGVIGGNTAATGVNLTANQGFESGTGTNSIAATTVNANDFCLITSSSSQLSGVVVTAQQ